LSVGSYSEEEPPESDDLLLKGFRTRKCDRAECVNDWDFPRTGFDAWLIGLQWNLLYVWARGRGYAGGQYICCGKSTRPGKL